MKTHAGHRDHDTGADLIPLEEAREGVLSRVEPLPAQELPLVDAHGCVLPADVAAPMDLPPFPSSAMDGFAVRAEDLTGATPGEPVFLRIAGRVAMGRRPEAAVGPGEAVAIPTGGAVPAGADSVLPIERCVVQGRRVAAVHTVPAGLYVRPAGEDVRAGETLVPAGRRLAAPEIALLASAGLAKVLVYPRARVAIVSTGDELVEPGHSASYGQVYDANAYTLMAAVTEAGAIPRRLGSFGDDADALEQVVRSADADVIVSSGGVSVGERDPVKRAFDGRGEIEFFDVAMQPGKPQAFGFIGGRPYFGLPGNPVSVFVSFEVFVRPALMKMMGRPQTRPEVTAVLESDVTGPKEKTQFARVRVRRTGEGWVAASTGGRQSNLLATVARANGLAIVPAGTETLHAGEVCRVMLFRDEP